MRFLCQLILFFGVITAISAAGDDELPLRQSDTMKKRFLVLKTGRVVQGELIPGPGGYDVSLPVGRMFVPSKQIRFTATSMDDAYQRMRDSIAELTPDAHIALARWCLVNRMEDKARREVLDALHLDPYRDDARRMLEDIVREQNRPRISVTTKPKASDEEKLLSPERRSLGGLPPDIAQTFTTRIQPLISNKCGNARCHGAGRNAFVVLPGLGRPTAHKTEQNLAAVLNQLDYDEPLNSPLLKATIGLHGGNRQLQFRGQSGGRQAQTLRRWVINAVQAIGGSPTPAKKVTSINPKVAAVTSAVKTEDSIHALADIDPSGRSRTRMESDQAALKQAVAATRHDDFNPNEFNQRFHGRSNQNPVSIRQTNVTEELR